MIVPEVGLDGQIRLKNSSVMVVGAGGLGSPAIAYLAGAGVNVGIVDPDVVEASNLHRQVIHNTDTVGTPKAISAKQFAEKLNPNIKVVAHVTALTATNALELCKGYDLILDCTDSPMSRYLVNDTAVILGIPLVSASALKTEGQLAIYNYKNGPCYRCMFPIPPPPHAVGACSDAGILGPVVGTMGTLQALEAIKLLAMENYEFTPSLLIFSATQFPPWRSMKIRGRQKNCAVCGDSPRITARNLADQDYAEFCGMASIEPIPSAWRLDPKDVPEDSEIIDVRPPAQFRICSLPNSRSIPLNELKKNPPTCTNDVIVVCRYGNDSQEAVRQLRDRGIQARDIRGGLFKWANDVDPEFPIY